MARDSRFILYIPTPYMESSVSPTSHGFFFHEIVLQGHNLHSYLTTSTVIIAFRRKHFVYVFLCIKIELTVWHDEVLEMVVATHSDTLHVTELCTLVVMELVYIMYILCIFYYIHQQFKKVLLDFLMVL